VVVDVPTIVELQRLSVDVDVTPANCFARALGTLKPIAGGASGVPQSVLTTETPCTKALVPDVKVRLVPPIFQTEREST